MQEKNRIRENRTSIDRHILKWSACMMARNEEDMVADTLSCIRNQTIPPTRIHVLDDGSTDSTGRILDGIDYVIVTCNPPHPPEQSDVRHYAKRYKIMREAANGMDYILCMDADVYIPPDYMERITESVRLDNAVVACGQDLAIPVTNPHAPGMVIDVKWFNTHPTLPTYPLNVLAAESVLDGHPCAVYATIQMRHKRPIGANYAPDVWKKRGENRRRCGVQFWWALLSFSRNHSWPFLYAYISYKGDRLPKRYGQYTNRLFMARIKRKFGLKQHTLLKTNLGFFILPKDYTKNHSLPPDCR